jgi:hypothetical protein
MVDFESREVSDAKKNEEIYDILKKDANNKKK